MVKRPKINTNEGPPGKNVQISAYVCERPDSTYPVVLKPYKLDLTQFGEKVRDEVDFKITNVSDKAVTPRVVYSVDDYFEIELPGSIEPGQTGIAKLKLRKEALGEEFEKSFTISLDDPQESRFTVPVKRKLRPTRGQSSGTADTESDSAEESSP